MRQDQMKKKLFNVFDPTEALPPNDPRYVECNAVRGSVGLLNVLADSIRLSDKRTCQLLSGHRGCGKTTELFRLRRLLRQDVSYAVVYCEATDYIDLADAVEYTEVLLAVVQQLWKDAEQQGIALEPGRLQTFLEGLWDILSAVVQPKDAKLKFPLFRIGF